jgi:hypothetical protein
MTHDGSATHTAQPTAQPEAPPPPDGQHASPLQRAAIVVAGGLLYFLLLDAAAETWFAASPIRWTAAAIVVAYFALSVLVRRRLAPGTRAALSLCALLVLLSFSAWQPDGAGVGIVMLRQTPGTVLAAMTMVAVLNAGWTLVRAAFLPVAVRIAVGLLAAYGLAAIVWGIAAATPYPALLHGQSLWTRLPVWLQGAFIGGLVLLPAAFLVQVGAAVVGRRGRSRRADALLATVTALSLVIVAAGFVGPTGTARATSGQVGLSTPSGPAGANAVMGTNGPGLRSLNIGSLALPIPRTFDLAHVQPEHFAVALGEDASRIFEFVRDQVAYEPYAGCLRGPRGTLLAMAGNSVDRAALLASLLAHAGHRVRYAQGQLPEDRARDLVASVWAERPPLVASAGPVSAEAAAAVDTLMAGINRDGALLSESLSKAGLPDRAEAPRPESLLAEARDHYWIQWWRDGRWVDLDPSFATATPGTAFAQVAGTFDALPDGLFHRVDIRIRVEEYKGAKPSSREILHYSAKAADLSGVDLVLTHLEERHRNQGGGSGLGAFASRSNDANQAGQLTPSLIVQGKRVVGLPFWQRAPRKAAGAGFESFLGGGAEEEPAPIAVAERIHFEFVGPGDRKEIVVREIFDLVGPARRSKGEKLSAAQVAAATGTAGSGVFAETVYDLFVTTGSIHAAHLMDVPVPPPPSETDPIDIRAGLQWINLLFSMTSDALIGRVVNAQGDACRFYLDSPRMQIAELSLKPGAVRLGLDLRRDQARAVGSGFRSGQLFGAQVLRGVVDGTLERVLVDFFAGSPTSSDPSVAAVMSTSWLFEQARASATATTLLSRDTAGLSGDVPADSRARVEEGLAAGHVALAPTGPIAMAGAPRFAWWQVDPRSGTTTAVTDEGLHQATVEVTLVEGRDGKTTVMTGVRGVRSTPISHNYGNYKGGFDYAMRVLEQAKAAGLNRAYRYVLLPY